MQVTYSMISRSVNKAQGNDLYIKWCFDINFKVVFSHLKFKISFRKTGNFGWGGDKFAPSRFFNISARKIFIVTNLLDFLQLLIVQLFKKFHLNILRNEGAGDNFLGLTLEKSQILKSQLSRKKEHRLNILQISFVLYCCLMHSITIILFGWKMWSKFNFIVIFLIVGQFCRSS